MTLDERITTALTGEPRSDDIAALIQDAESALHDADDDIERHGERSLDPLCPAEEAVQAREAFTAAHLARDRLITALPRLRAKLKEARAAEYAVQWQAEYERAEAKRNDLARELADVYPAAVARLIDLFWRIRETDEELYAINSAAPNGKRRLQRVERHALELPDDFGNTSPLVDRAQLPAWSGDRTMAWPPFRPPVLTAFAFASSYPAGPSADWVAQRERDAERRRAEAERLSAYHQEQTRIQEERLNREEREAFTARQSKQRGF